MNKIECVFSPSRRYRYVWKTRTINREDGRLCAFIGLNCSTADENGPDNTVRICLNHATRWGFEHFVMLNLFAFRATDPKVMKAALDPIGPYNDYWIGHYVGRADLIVTAWGNDGAYLNRDEQVIKLLRKSACIDAWPPLCLAKTKAGHPHHPLYLKADLKPVPLD